MPNNESLGMSLLIPNKAEKVNNQIKEEILDTPEHLFALDVSTPRARGDLEVDAAQNWRLDNWLSWVGTSL